jgi:UMF1 family MFS transporter
MNHKREITGWAMYDWANSAFSTTVVTAFLGPYLAALIASRPGETLPLHTYLIEPEAFYPLCVTVSVILQVLFLPLLGALADLTNLKKRLLILFATTGATATIFLGLISSGAGVWAGGLLFILANFSFGAAVVFYNAYLPDIAPPEAQDRVSSLGFAYGYVGGGLLLALNLALFQLLENTAVAVRFSLASAGVWWLLFTWLYPKRRLVVRDTAVAPPPTANFVYPRPQPISPHLTHYGPPYAPHPAIPHRLSHLQRRHHDRQHRRRHLRRLRIGDGARAVGGRHPDDSVCGRPGRDCCSTRLPAASAPSGQ